MKIEIEDNQVELIDKCNCCETNVFIHVKKYLGSFRVKDFEEIVIGSEDYQKTIRICNDCLLERMPEVNWKKIWKEVKKNEYKNRR